MTKETTFSSEFAEISRDEVEKLKSLINKSKNEEICETIVKSAGEDYGLKVWTSVLSLLDDEHKMLKIVEDVS